MEWSHPAWLSEEQRSFADVVRRFAAADLADGELADRDRAGTFWRDGWARCAAMGLCGLPAPAAFGGAGADRVTTAAALEALGYGCADGGLVFSLNAHLWSAVMPIATHGTDEQRSTYLPKLCSGEWIGLHAMTEPESGSDAFSLATTARPDGDGWVLSGRKTLITNAPVADLFVVFARLPQTEGALGVTAFIVEAGADGLLVDRAIDKLGLRTSPMAEIVLENVTVAPAAVLGRRGRGAGVFATSMQWERSLIMAGVLGGLERSLDEAVLYARQRRQFGRPIASFQAVSDKLVDIKVAVEAARALLFETAARYDTGDAGAAPAAAVKLCAAEVAVRAAVDLMQVYGGYGYTSDLPVERRLRDALGAPLYSGTSDMMRRLVARSMGL